MNTELAEQPKVLAFLQAQQARFPNFIISDSDDRREAWIDARVGTQVTPAYLLLDRGGSRVPLDGDATPAGGRRRRPATAGQAGRPVRAAALSWRSCRWCCRL